MSPLVYIIAGIVFLAALTGAYLKVHGDGVTQGKAEVQTLWDAANRKAQAEEAARLAAADLTAKTHAAELAAMQQKATTFEQKWRQERAKQSNSTLAGCITAPTASSTATAGTQPSVRFSNGFVRLYDSAWTGDAGESIFGNSTTPAGYTATAADALSDIGPGEVLDNFQANAALCSADRRKLNSLIGQIEALRAGWH